MKKSFIPHGYTIDRERIAEMITTELQQIHGLGIPAIEPHDPRLTDELCQEITDAWYEEPNPNPAIGDLWESEDDISEEWSQKLLAIFGKELMTIEKVKAYLEQKIQPLKERSSRESELVEATLNDILNYINYA